MFVFDVGVDVHHDPKPNAVLMTKSGWAISAETWRDVDKLPSDSGATKPQAARRALARRGRFYFDRTLRGVRIAQDAAGTREMRRYSATVAPQRFVNQAHLALRPAPDDGAQRWGTC